MKDDWLLVSRRLSGSEGDDAADRVVWGNADGDAVAGDDLDPETPHTATQLGEHFMARVALHSVKPAGVDRHDGPLHINQIVLAQQLILSRNLAMSVPHGRFQRKSNKCCKLRIRATCRVETSYPHLIVP